MLLDLYEPVVACPECCAGIIRDQGTHIPRGFFTEAEVGDPVALLVVAQNPGGPQKREVNLYRNLTSKAAVRAHVDFARRSFLAGEGTPFHSRLLAWLGDLLEIDESQVFRHVVYTNAVKCTTPGNNLPLPMVATTCVRLHLRREIASWMPRSVVALGGGAHRLLAASGVAHECLPHPRHRRDGEYHRAPLEALRAKLRANGPNATDGAGRHF